MNENNNTNFLIIRNSFYYMILIDFMGINNNKINLKNLDFDFDTVGITKEQYENTINRINNQSGITVHSHSLMMNDLIIHVDENEYTEINNGNLKLPSDMLIRSLKRNSNQNIIVVHVLMTKWLCTREEVNEYYPNRQSDLEHIGYVYAELDLHECSQKLNILGPTDSGRYMIKVELRNFSIAFEKIIQTIRQVGFCIHSATISDGRIESVTIIETGELLFDDSVIENNQLDKLRNIASDKFLNSDPIQIPGTDKLAYPKVKFIIKENYKDMGETNTIQVKKHLNNNLKTIELSKVNSDSNNLSLNVANIEEGYHCPVDDSFYIFNQYNKLSIHMFLDEVEKECDSVDISVDIEDKSYNFTLLNRSLFEFF